MGLTNPENEIFDGNIDLSATRKKRFRVNENNNMVLELNTSDMSTLVRLKEDYPKLLKLANKITNIKSEMEGETQEEEIAKAADLIKSIDEEMRQLVDHIFDADVSEKCAPQGTMYDLFNGMFRFEYIIEKIGALYGENITNEMKAVKARVQKHTKKYTGKR